LFSPLPHTPWAFWLGFESRVRHTISFPCVPGRFSGRICPWKKFGFFFLDFQRWWPRRRFFPFFAFTLRGKTEVCVSSFISAWGLRLNTFLDVAVISFSRFCCPRFFSKKILPMKTPCHQGQTILGLSHTWMDVSPPPRASTFFCFVVDVAPNPLIFSLSFANCSFLVRQHLSGSRLSTTRVSSLRDFVPPVFIPRLKLNFWLTADAFHGLFRDHQKKFARTRSLKLSCRFPPLFTPCRASRLLWLVFLCYFCFFFFFFLGGVFHSGHSSCFPFSSSRSFFVHFFLGGVLGCRFFF